MKVKIDKNYLEALISDYIVLNYGFDEYGTPKDEKFEYHGDADYAAEELAEHLIANTHTWAHLPEVQLVIKARRGVKR